MIEMLKRQWFVVLVALIFIGFAVFCIYDSNKDRVSGKTNDGKDVVAAMKDDTYIYADDLDKILYNNYGSNLVSTKFQIAVVSQAVKENDELKTQASNYKANFITQAESNMSMYGYTDLKEYINAQLNPLGYDYDTLDEYAMLAVKMNKLTSDYVKAHLDTLFTDYYNAKQPRTVSHILIKMADPQNPTEEEKEKIEKVEKELAAGKDFAEVAKKYSDDTGSKENGGYLGLMDKDTQYVESFKNAAFKLKSGEVSEWVKGDNSSYKGWHMIKVHETDKDKLLKDKDLEDTLVNAILNSDTSNAYGNAIWEASKKLDIKYNDKDLEAQIKASLGLK